MNKWSRASLATLVTVVAGAVAGALPGAAQAASPCEAVFGTTCEEALVPYTGDTADRTLRRPEELCRQTHNGYTCGEAWAATVEGLVDLGLRVTDNACRATTDAASCGNLVGNAVRTGVAYPPTVDDACKSTSGGRTCSVVLGDALEAFINSGLSAPTARCQEAFGRTCGQQAGDLVRIGLDRVNPGPDCYTLYLNSCGWAINSLAALLTHEADAAADVEGTRDNYRRTAETAGSDRNLPGNGYSFDQHWNCGQISLRDEVCYAAGTRDEAWADRHSYGWASADYDGGGSIKVCVRTYRFADCGYNLTRACYYSSCNDQNVDKRLIVWVSNAEENGSRHTVYGHAKA